MKWLAVLAVFASLGIVAFGTYTETTFVSAVVEPEYNYRFYFPLIALDQQHGRIDGPGVAGCPWQEWELNTIGANWCYWWNPNCNGVPWCVPMLRAKFDFNIQDAMWSCGGLCGSVMFLNEPNLWMQDNCDVDCQVQFLHDNYAAVKAINPNAEVVFGNFWRPSRTLLQAVVDKWAQLYPGEPFPDVTWGVHNYGWQNYDRDRWRQELTEFCELAGKCALTEYGALFSKAMWKQVVGDQAGWLGSQGIPAAPFMWGRPEDGFFCQMWDDGKLTECGEAYRDALESK